MLPSPTPAGKPEPPTTVPPALPGRPAPPIATVINPAVRISLDFSAQSGPTGGRRGFLDLAHHSARWNGAYWIHFVRGCMTPVRTNPISRKESKDPLITQALIAEMYFSAIPRCRYAGYSSRAARSPQAAWRDGCDSMVFANGLTTTQGTRERVLARTRLTSWHQWVPIQSAPCGAATPSALSSSCTKQGFDSRGVRRYLPYHANGYFKQRPNCITCRTPAARRH